MYFTFLHFKAFSATSTDSKLTQLHQIKLKCCEIRTSVSKKNQLLMELFTLSTLSVIPN